MQWQEDEKVPHMNIEWLPFAATFLMKTRTASVMPSGSFVTTVVVADCSYGGWYPHIILCGRLLGEVLNVMVYIVSEGSTDSTCFYYFSFHFFPPARNMVTGWPVNSIVATSAKEKL